MTRGIHLFHRALEQYMRARSSTNAAYERSLYQWYRAVIATVHDILSMLRSAHKLLLGRRLCRTSQIPSACGPIACSNEFACATVQSISYMHNVVSDTLLFILRCRLYTVMPTFTTMILRRSNGGTAASTRSCSKRKQYYGDHVNDVE